MPDLLQLRYLAKKQPQLYEQEVQQQYSTYQALLELYKIQKDLKSDNLLQIIEFLTQLVPYYKIMLKDFPQTLFQLIGDVNQEIDPQLRLTIIGHIKQLFSKKILQLDQNNVQQLISMLCIHDKALRQNVQQLLLQQLPFQIKDVQIMTQFTSICLSEQSSLLTKTKLMEVLHELFYSGKLVNSNADYKIVHLFEQMLCRSPDKRVIILSLNFFLAQQAQNEVEDDDEDSDARNSDGEGMTVQEAVHNDEIKKLMNQLQKATKIYKLDETKRRREIEKIQTKIRKLRYKDNKTTNNVSNVLDLIDDHYDLIDKLQKKFIQNSCQFSIRLRVFEFIAVMSEHQNLQVPGLFAQFCRFIRPSQENVTLLLQYMIKSVNENQDMEEVVQAIKHIYFNFIHSGSTDDEMVVGLNAIRGICTKCPQCLLQDEDGISLLNELVSLHSEREAKKSRHATQSHTMTSSATRKGVMMAAKGLLNFYRMVAPGYLHKSLLNTDARQLLHNLKLYGEDEMVVADVNKTKSQFRIPNIHILDQPESSNYYESESSSESLQAQKCQKRLKSQLDSILFQVRNDGKVLEERTINELKKAFGVTVDKHGNILDAPPEMLLDQDNQDGELAYVSEEEEDSQLLSENIEEFNEEEEEFTSFDEEYNKEETNAQIDVQSTQRKKPNVLLYQEEVSEREDNEQKGNTFQFDPSTPIEQQRILTQQELNRLKKYRQQLKQANAIDLNEYIQRRKMTAEEKRQHTRESRVPEAHKTSFWNRKDITRKSRTNKEKLNLKPIAMTIHSTQVKKRLGRTRKEKERVRRQHAYNSKRGISKKINR